jgi:hypothetical protein
MVLRRCCLTIFTTLNKCLSDFWNGSLLSSRLIGSYLLPYWLKNAAPDRTLPSLRGQTLANSRLVDFINISEAQNLCPDKYWTSVLGNGYGLVKESVNFRAIWLNSP